MNGLFDGFMWGGITAGVSNVIKPGSFCFIAGTKVLTDSGQKNIEDIKVGDQVLAYDEETGVTAYKPVLHLFRNKSRELAHVTIDNCEIICTPGHKFYTQNCGWKNAKDLKKSDILLLSDGSQAHIANVYVKRLEEEVTVYNFEVADFHTYYVADCNVLVHNRNCNYYKATRQNEKLVRGRRISQKQALDQIRNGNDIISSSRSGAKSLAKKAFGNSRVYSEIHPYIDNAMPHFHDARHHIYHIFFD